MDLILFAYTERRNPVAQTTIKGRDTSRPPEGSTVASFPWAGSPDPSFRLVGGCPLLVARET